MKCKWILGTLIILMITATVTAEKIGTLEGIYKPQMIKAFDDELFVVEGQTIFILSRDNLSFRKKIGKTGPGPAEFKLDPSRTLIITVFPKYILAESRYKLVYFSRDGEFLKEKRKMPGTLQTLPLGENYAVHKILFGPKGQNHFAVSIHDKNMKEIKELHRQKFFQFQDRLHLIPDALNICIADNKLFLEKSQEGFLIDVYDTNGKKLYSITKKIKQIPVTGSHKKRALADYMQIPFIRRMIKEKGKAETMRMINQQTLVFPENIPAIDYLTVDGNRLIAKIPWKLNALVHFLAMDTSGKTIRNCTLPKAREVDFLVQMQGDKKFYTFYDHRYYYLVCKELEDGEEEWEVHAETYLQ